MLFYGRANDAFDQIAKAAQIIKDQKMDKEKDRDDEFFQKYIQKYELGNFESELEQFKDKYDRLTKEDINEELLSSINKNRSHWAGLKLYFRKVCPLVRNPYDREQFLNTLIQDLYFQCEDIIEDKKKVRDKIIKMEKQIPEAEEGVDEEELLAQNEDPDNPVKFKKKKK